MLHIVGTAALLVGLTACVPQEKYNALKLERDGYAEQLGKAQTDAAAARQEADAYKNQIAMLGNGSNGLQGLVTNLTAQNSALQTQLEELNRRYAEALNRPVGSAPLPKELNDALSAFAAQNSDLVDFDSARGIVKFKSDVTFAVGDATLEPGAKTAIQRFASILNASGASQYELLIAGHTDNQRVSNPQTIAKGHKDNWYLSAHRAISVSEELIARGTNAQRIGVVGYADQRPATSNSSEAGRKSNRRVEVLILPSTVRSTAPVAAAPKPSGNSNRPSSPPNKDSGGGANVSTDTRPINNK